jgi:hypothetical protein
VLLDPGKRGPTEEVASDPALEGCLWPLDRPGGGLAPLKLGPNTGRKASGGASWRYLAFFRTPSWHWSARFLLIHL